MPSYEVEVKTRTTYHIEADDPEQAQEEIEMHLGQYDDLAVTITPLTKRSEIINSRNINRHI